MDWALRVIDVHTYRPEKEIRQMFSTFGDLRSFHPWSTGRTDKHHYFVEYTHSTAAERARAACMIQAPDIQVHSLALNIGMQDRFCALASRSGDHTNSRVILDEYSGRSSKAGTLNASLQSSRSSHAQPSRLKVASVSSSSCSLSSPTITATLAPPPTAMHDKKFSRSASKRAPSKSFSQTFNSRCRTTISTRCKSEPSEKDLPDPGSAPCGAASKIADKTTALNRQQHTTISLHLFSTAIEYDLETLEETPCSIIFLLSQDDNFDMRANWMMVAAQYRRKRNHVAALTVMTEFLRIMATQGVQDGELKPAYLLLSQCHADLARTLETSDGAESPSAVHHRKQSVEWIQRVYGNPTALPVAKIADSAAPHIPSQAKRKSLSQSGVNKENEPKNQRSCPISVTPTNSCTAPTTRTNLADGLISDAYFAPTTPHLPHLPNGTPTTSATARLKVLQSELRDLREQQVAESTLLADVRARKRSAEETADSERKQRRRLEDAESDLAKARRMKVYAREEGRREAEARRTAEDREKDEHKQSAAALAAIPEKAAKAIFGELAALFRRAEQAPSVILNAVKTGAVLDETGTFGRD